MEIEMKNIDLKTIFIGIFVFAFIFFEISERRAKPSQSIKELWKKNWEGKSGPATKYTTRTETSWTTALQIFK